MKHKISLRLGIPADEQRLIYLQQHGVIHLEDWRTISDYGIQPDQGFRRSVDTFDASQVQQEHEQKTSENSPV